MNKHNRSKQNAPVAKGSSNTSHQAPTKIVTITGTDLVYSGRTKGVGQSIVLSQLITPALFARAKRIASSFQHYKFEGITFHITCEGSSMTSGGLACAYLTDATDEIATGDLARVLACSHSTKCKAWENATLRCPKSKWLYTSGSVEIRESVAGRLVIMRTGDIDQDASILIQATWKLSFKEGTLEEENLHEGLMLKQGLFMNVDLVTAEGQGNLSFVDGKGNKTAFSIKEAFEDSSGLLELLATKAEVIFTLPVPITFAASEEGDDTPLVARYLAVVNNGGNYGFYVRQLPQVPLDAQHSLVFNRSVMVLAQGEELLPYKAVSVLGETDMAFTTRGRRSNGRHILASSLVPRSTPSEMPWYSRVC